MIRLARDTDLPVLQDIERAAGEPFRAHDMAAVADDQPPTIAELTEFHKDGRCWVVTDDADHDTDRPIGYLLGAVIDGHAHVEQVSVHPGHWRRGHGRRLIDTLAAWAADRGLAGLTLTTFADIPWNAPYYERLGFRVLAEDELTDGLRQVRAHEAERGLDAWPRVTMRRG
jgi:GNAT superfamily N-acetyltransferase